MILNKKSLEKLRLLINEETEYRSGPQLVRFFNEFGSNDSYGPGFPSRWFYTDGKLEAINGTPELDKCIKSLFAPVNYVGRYAVLDQLISEFNQFMAFDGWKVERNNAEISFKKIKGLSIPPSVREQAVSEDSFLSQEFNSVSLNDLNLNSQLSEVINSRFEEISRCLQHNASLAAVFLSGSSLEGILLGIASENPKVFNQARTAPRREGKVRPFHEWTLSNLIDTSHELGILKEDVRKFSHVLRDFRNYIHPLQQTAAGFQPDLHTARICWQVLKAAVFQLSSSYSLLRKD